MLRIVLFLHQRYMPVVMIPGGVTHFAAIYFSLQALARPGPLVVTTNAVAGAVAVILFSLLMRVYDELKDVETDVRLGRAGDPSYKDRPIVSGKITLQDLVVLRWVTSALLAASIVLTRQALPIAVGAGVFLLMWLSFKWFFCPAISKNLLLAFVTHNPIALTVAVFVVSVGATEVPVRFGWPSLLVIGLWMPTAAWETSRKIRRPSEETEYQTYSKVLGWRAATLLPAGFTAVSLACLLPVGLAMDLPVWFPFALSIPGIALVAACLLFLLRPTSRRAHLRPYAEVYGATANLALVVALLLR